MGVAFKRKRWREQHRLRVDVNGMMARLIGAAGSSDADVEALIPQLAQIHAAREDRLRTGQLAGATPRDADLGPMLALAGELRPHFDDLVVLGSGDAVRAGRALYQALTPPGHAFASPVAGAMRLHVADSIDPTSFAALLDRLDPRRTLFNVVSASGDTPETMSQFMIVREYLLRELGAVEYKHHLVITTDAARGTLRQIVNDEGFRDLPMLDGVVGSSALTASGLFPAACAGIDAAELLAGVADMDARCRVPEPHASPVALLAATASLALTRSGRGAGVVLVPYCEALTAVGDWFDRLWIDGRRPAADPRGGARALVVFVRVEAHARALSVPTSYEDLETVSYLGGQDLGALFNLEQQAAEIALGKTGLPSATVVCPRVNPFVVGALMHLLASAAEVLTGLLGVDVAGSACGEETSQLVHGLAGRSGCEAAGAEAQRWLTRKEERYVI